MSVGGKLHLACDGDEVLGDRPEGCERVGPHWDIQDGMVDDARRDAASTGWTRPRYRTARGAAHELGLRVDLCPYCSAVFLKKDPKQ